MLTIARALMTNPDLLLFDEPSEGLAPVVVDEVFRIIGQLKEAGESILLVEQDFGMATLVRKTDLVITAAGLALPLQAHIAGTPLLIVVNRGHVEHARNADVIEREGMGSVVGRWEDADEGAARALAMVSKSLFSRPPTEEKNSSSRNLERELMNP